LAPNVVVGGFAGLNMESLRNRENIFSKRSWTRRNRSLNAERGDRTWRLVR